MDRQMKRQMQRFYKKMERFKLLYMLGKDLIVGHPTMSLVRTVATFVDLQMILATIFLINLSIELQKCCPQNSGIFRTFWSQTDLNLTMTRPTF